MSSQPTRSAGTLRCRIRPVPSKMVLTGPLRCPGDDLAFVPMVDAQSEGPGQNKDKVKR